MRLPSADAQAKDVPDEPDDDISVPSNGYVPTPGVQPVSDGNGHDGSPPAQDIPEAAATPLEPHVEPPSVETHTEEPQTEEPRAVERHTEEKQTEEPPRRETPTPVRSNGGSSPDPRPDSSTPANRPKPSIPPELSDPRLGHDFTVFCRTVNPLGDMRKVVAAAEGAARMFSMANVDSWELGHLFDMAGWSQPHSFTQALRNAARSKFRWLERVPGRSGRYSVTDAGRAVVLNGTNLL